ncbi:hypothetical protein TNCV_776371 [Trichonephila clavipes]|nr:hypothetical protein TNCV_776371 [Trichonephila clavipes]
MGNLPKAWALVARNEYSSAILDISPSSLLIAVNSEAELESHSITIRQTARKILPEHWLRGKLSHYYPNYTSDRDKDASRILNVSWTIALVFAFCCWSRSTITFLKQCGYVPPIRANIVEWQHHSDPNVKCFSCNIEIFLF